MKEFSLDEYESVKTFIAISVHCKDVRSSFRHNLEK